MHALKRAHRGLGFGNDCTGRRCPEEMKKNLSKNGKLVRMRVCVHTIREASIVSGFRYDQETLLMDISSLHLLEIIVIDGGGNCVRKHEVAVRARCVWRHLKDQAQKNTQLS